MVIRAPSADHRSTGAGWDTPSARTRWRSRPARLLARSGHPGRRRGGAGRRSAASPGLESSAAAGWIGPGPRRCGHRRSGRRGTAGRSERGGIAGLLVAAYQVGLVARWGGGRLRQRARRRGREHDAGRDVSGGELEPPAGAPARGRVRRRTAWPGRRGGRPRTPAAASAGRVRKTEPLYSDDITTEGGAGLQAGNLRRPGR